LKKGGHGFLCRKKWPRPGRNFERFFIHYTDFSMQIRGGSVKGQSIFGDFVSSLLQNLG
jgi:hypothetical protein